MKSCVSEFLSRSVVHLCRSDRFFFSFYYYSFFLFFLPSGRFHSKTAAFGSTGPPGDPSRYEPRQSNSPWAWRCSCPLPGWSAGGGWSPSSAPPRSPPPRCPWCWSACASPGRSEASPWCPGVCGFRARQQVKLGGEKGAHFYVAGSSWCRPWLVDAGGRVRLKTRPLLGHQEVAEQTNYCIYWCFGGFWI